MCFRAANYPVSTLLVGASLVGCASVPTGRVGVHVVSPLARVYQVDLREASSVPPQVSSR